MGRKQENTKGVGGLAEPGLLLLRPPSPVLAGPLEAFQRALLYLIKPVKHQAKLQDLLFFLYFLQTQAWNLKKRVLVKEVEMQN